MVAKKQILMVAKKKTKRQIENLITSTCRAGKVAIGM